MLIDITENERKILERICTRTIEEEKEKIARIYIRSKLSSETNNGVSQKNIDYDITVLITLLNKFRQLDTTLLS